MDSPYKFNVQQKDLQPILQPQWFPQYYLVQTKRAVDNGFYVFLKSFWTITSTNDLKSQRLITFTLKHFFKDHWILALKVAQIASNSETKSISSEVAQRQDKPDPCLRWHLD
ncbi:hypothetical protein TNCV_3448961 [Trichonephila clavipes]|nr:hypothetical protein TNCV_3448961 [Trichonephila clavipes]